MAGVLGGPRSWGVRMELKQLSLELKDTPPTDCPSCCAPWGEVHAGLCDVERCSHGGLQRIGCESDLHDPAFARWTGYWPGAVEAELFFAGDLNLLVASDQFRRMFLTKPGARKLEPRAGFFRMREVEDAVIAGTPSPPGLWQFDHAKPMCWRLLAPDASAEEPTGSTCILPRGHDGGEHEVDASA